MNRNQRDGMLLVLLSAVGYACLPIFTKTLYEAEVPMQPLDVVTWRFIMAAPMIWLVLALSGNLQTEKPLPRLRLLGLGLLFSLAAGSAFFGLDLIPASTYVVLFYCYPAVVALIGLFTGERLPVRGWVALGLTLVGVALTAPDFSEGLRGDNFLGAALAVGNAIVVAVYMTVSNRLLREHSARAQASAWMISGTLIVFVVLAVLRGGVALPPNPSAWLFLFGLGTVSTALPIFAVYAAMQRLGAARVAILGTIEPILTVTLAAVILHEQLLDIQLVGGLLILFSILLLQSGELLKLRFPRTAVWRSES